MSSVTFENVVKSYDAFAVVKNISFKVNDGDFVSFLGPSGCGKTTCLRMVAGLEINTSGTIKLDDLAVSAPEKGIFIPPEKRQLGMVFQSYAIWPHMNVFENVAFPLKIKKVDKSEMTDRVNAILKIVELAGLEERKPNQLSGGQQQRVALARGLVARPKVLLLDEPLSNLDAKLREKMRVDIRRIQKEFGITCIYVTHDQIEAFTMSDQIAVMKNGHILQQGTPEQIRQSPVDEWVAEFIRPQNH
jgi:iron(III) transport system ATP-binding protein